MLLLTSTLSEAARPRDRLALPRALGQAARARCARSACLCLAVSFRAAAAAARAGAVRFAAIAAMARWRAACFARALRQHGGVAPPPSFAPRALPPARLPPAVDRRLGRLRRPDLLAGRGSRWRPVGAAAGDLDARYV